MLSFPRTKDVCLEMAYLDLTKESKNMKTAIYNDDNLTHGICFWVQ